MSIKYKIFFSDSIIYLSWVGEGACVQLKIIFLWTATYIVYDFTTDIFFIIALRTAFSVPNIYQTYYFLPRNFLALYQKWRKALAICCQITSSIFQFLGYSQLRKPLMCAIQLSKFITQFPKDSFICLFRLAFHDFVSKFLCTWKIIVIQTVVNLLVNSNQN